MRGSSVRRGRGPDDEVQVCDGCGSTATRPANRWEALGRWLDSGAGAGRGWRCTGCGASWWGGSSYLVAVHRSGPARLLRLPLDVLDAVRAARTWHPVPRFYVIVGVVALVPAALVAVLPRVRWWAALLGVPIGAMVVVFLWSMTTGLGRRARRDVLRRLAPRRAAQRDTAEDVTELTRQLGGFTLLAPATWDGELTIGGMGWSVPPRGPRVLQEVTVTADQGDPLLHPDVHTPGWHPPGPRVEVRVTEEPHGIGDEEVAYDLAARATEPTSGWRAGHLTVDGAEIATRVLEAEGAAAASFDLGGRRVLVVAEGLAVDGLALRRIEDPAGLLDSYVARHQRMVQGMLG